MHRRSVGLLVGAALSVGCASEVVERTGGPDFAPAEVLPTSCGEIAYEQGDGVATQEEWYAFENMNERLAASPELRRHSGLTRVESCDQARGLIKAIHSLEEPAVVAPDADAQEPQLADADDVLVEKIFNGTASPVRSVVRYSTPGGLCTGTLLSGRAMLTAAHCIRSAALYLDTNNDGTGDAGLESFTIEYDVAPGFDNPTVYCLTAANDTAAPGSCSSSESRTFTVHVHPSYSGNGDTGYDVALVIASTRWYGIAGTQSVHWSRVNSGGLKEDDDFWPSGQGSNANGGTLYLNENGDWSQTGTGYGVLRFDAGQANIDWLGSGHFYHTGDHVRTCKGDSGGPAHETNANSVAGVMSNVDYNSDYGSMANPVKACAQVGYKQRWARTSNKFTWFNSVLASYNAPTCGSAATISGVSYRQCW